MRFKFVECAGCTSAWCSVHKECVKAGAQGQGDAVVTDIAKRTRDAAAQHGGSWLALEAEILAHDATKAALAERDAEIAAFRREVSEVAKKVVRWADPEGSIGQTMAPFILPEPVDPLVEALRSIGLDKADEWAGDIRKAAIAHGLTIQEQQP